MQEASASTIDTAQGVELDPEQLSPGALRGLIEEFVTREGTDYGAGGATVEAEPEWSLEEKVTQVYRQLSSGEARVVFDLESESASIVPLRTLEQGNGGPRRAETGSGAP
ncbi:MAG: YheU family protein [Deltaproteobacteria bacterium]|jgi:uncharacterized protein YheU (UPF0270 family)|nr:YheU family protein [Deltaproteobacteria bacterium]MBW2501003.1 YheU family protein [Deltaproteobacteria bacterium]